RLRFSRALRRAAAQRAGQKARLRARKSKQRQELAAVHGAHLSEKGQIVQRRRGSTSRAARRDCYCFSKATVISSSTSSPMPNGIPQGMLNSERLIVVSPWKPTVFFWFIPFVPAPASSASIVTGLVTPLRVRLPVMLASSSSVTCTEVETKRAGAGFGPK